MHHKIYHIVLFRLASRTSPCLQSLHQRGLAMSSAALDAEYVVALSPMVATSAAVFSTSTRRLTAFCPATSLTSFTCALQRSTSNQLRGASPNAARGWMAFVACLIKQRRNLILYKEMLKRPPLGLCSGPDLARHRHRRVSPIELPSSYRVIKTPLHNRALPASS